MECFNDWSNFKNAETREKYNIAKKKTKNVVSEARTQDFDGLYQSLGTKEEERSKYILAKGTERKTNDFDQWSVLKMKTLKVLVHEK